MKKMDPYEITDAEKQKQIEEMWKKHENKSTERDMFSFLEDDDDYVDEYEDESYESMDNTTDQNVSIDDTQDNEEPEPIRPRRRIQRSKRRKVTVQSTEPNDAKKLLESSSNEVVRKRRARRSEHATVKTKKRRLSDSQTTEVRPRKRRAVKRSPSSDESMDETLKRFVSDSPEER